MSPSGADAGPPSLLSDDLPAAAAEAATVPGGACRSVFALDSPPLWGLESVCGRRPEMEDAAAVAPRFYRVPLWMVAGDGAAVDGLDRASFRLPAHFFAMYNDQGGAGAHVADYCQDRLHAVLAQEVCAAEDRVGASDNLPVLPADALSSRPFQADGAPPFRVISPPTRHCVRPGRRRLVIQRHRSPSARVVVVERCCLGEARAEANGRRRPCSLTLLLGVKHDGCLFHALFAVRTVSHVCMTPSFPTARYIPGKRHRLITESSTAVGNFLSTTPAVLFVWYTNSEGKFVQF